VAVSAVCVAAVSVCVAVVCVVACAAAACVQAVVQAFVVEVSAALVLAVSVLPVSAVVAVAAVAAVAAVVAAMTATITAITVSRLLLFKHCFDLLELKVKFYEKEVSLQVLPQGHFLHYGAFIFIGDLVAQFSERNTSILRDFIEEVPFYLVTDGFSKLSYSSPSIWLFLFLALFCIREDY
jgi:hypothetical protein